ncbi:TetR/AcrR family transcriptional regulator [Brevibacillus sp. 7WMA2]|uniref:TetR family transcriptional regulator n=1 Tax=Brevibacillus TaxID=55080 RepID=UPI0013A7202A|nr:MULTISPECIES: TetR family transcriptional regulator [Brevibacillus]MCR8996848.1 TetR/AcrR family transcriptional regulator [Brevibacillus laterosporus]MDF9412510.1 TetR/AcrR family transcriptional regulator [Brevibacillus laterosporus]QIC07444.1 TetR/AcrR family transcriptional regulator [Brevibacillus sp. 7WMA2]WPS88346.1 TetR family transcriptional regulator [Brevibacillus halotolerans]
MAPRVSEEYKKQKKMDLLQAAKRVFVEKGYTRATMQDIMDEADVSRGALYSYFDNIEHVYLELLHAEDEKDAMFFRLDENGTSWQQITKWVNRQQQEMQRLNQSLLLANSEFFLSTNYRKNRDSYPYVTTRYQRLAEVIIAFFRKGIEQGDICPRIPVESISLYLISFMDGLMLDTAHLGPEKTKVKEQLEVLLFSLREMLCPIAEK